MEVEIVENRKQSLFAYKNGELLFYSTIKFNWFNRIVSIYNQNNDLLLELKCRSSILKSTYKILFQNQSLNPFINEISSTSIIFNCDECLTLKLKYLISFDYDYYFQDDKIAELTKKIWSSSSKEILKINEDKLQYLDQILIHVLSIETGVSVV